MAIEGFIGTPGSGKSYSLTHIALEHADRGRSVFVNYALAHPNVYQFGPEDLLDLPPGLIVIDEAHLWFSSRQSLKLPPSWLAGLSQTRKRGWDLYWAAQHESRVDRVLRDVSSWFWLCSSWFKHQGHAVVFKQECYEPERFRNPKGKVGSRYRIFSKRVARAYDTFESLTVADHTKSANDPYAKAT